MSSMTAQILGQGNELGLTGQGFEEPCKIGSGFEALDAAYAS